MYNILVLKEGESYQGNYHFQYFSVGNTEFFHNFQPRVFETIHLNFKITSIRQQSVNSWNGGFFTRGFSTIGRSGKKGANLPFFSTATFWSPSVDPSLQELKADRPHPRNYLHTPTDYRYTDNHLRLVTVVGALCCTRQGRAPNIDRCAPEI